MMNDFQSGEERANVLTHATGVIASVAGGALLIVLAAMYGSAWHVVGTAVFTASLVLLYSASTAYHSAVGEVRQRRLRIFDHCAIYVLIAGTYTPFTLTALRGPWGWSLFGVVWGLALAGIVFKLFFVDHFPRISTAIYVGMGWLIVVAAGPMLRSLDQSVLLFLLLGGIAYTAGTAFYHNRRIPYAHAVWHVFVLAGSAFHALAIGIQTVSIT